MPAARTRLALALLLAAAAGRAAPPPAGAPATAPGPADRPARGPISFRPGVALDWQGPAVRVDARVVLRAGPLEFLACGPGKEHESILRLEAAATHIYMALGLIGLTPGHPPAWDAGAGGFAPPAGDLLEIALEWSQEGRPQSADAFAWLREIEYARTPVPRPWVFGGSRPREDGTLWSDVTGVAVALVDFPDSLICLSRRHSSASGELWAAAHTSAIPPEGTAVQLVLRPAGPRPRVVRVDGRGAAWVDGVYCAWPDLVDVLALEHRLAPGRVQSIVLAGTLRSDRAALRRLLAGELPPEAVRFVVEEGR